MTTDAAPFPASKLFRRAVADYGQSSLAMGSEALRWLTQDAPVRAHTLECPLECGQVARDGAGDAA